MNILNDANLANYSTMHLGGTAKHLVTITSEEELLEAFNWANQNNLKCLVIGSGSNIVWRDQGFEGLIIVNKILGFNIVQTENDRTAIEIGAGEIWDEIVSTVCQLNLSGIEALSLIPGTAGATPVQNVGAYGQEISSVLISVKVLDVFTGSFVVLENKQLEFSYRSSILKSDPGKYYISSLKLSLSNMHLSPPFYSSLAHYLEVNNIVDYSPASIRQAVINIRNAKLPDPKLIHNCGSFFANPIISSDQFNKLQTDLNEDIPHWDAGNSQQKVAAAWLIEKVGYKDFHDPITGIATWKNQPLVLVNENAKSTADLLDFRNQIVRKVENKFGITLEQEPLLL
jgi:UDP-N-acetylmuramate dehydrogenase